MTEYRVGQEGASVFDADGHLLARLGPGATIVPGSLDETVLPRTPDQEYPTRRPASDGKRIRGYEDKRMHPHESTAD